MAHIGKKIKEVRLERNLTQEELAELMGYKSKTTINKIELGVNDIPQAKIKKFAEVLHTTPARLMGWEDAIEEAPVDFAHKLADLFLQIDFKDEEFPGLCDMLEEYQSLPSIKKEQVREYIHLLSKRH